MKKLIILLLIATFATFGCIGLQTQSEQTGAQFHTYPAKAVPGDADLGLIADQNAANAIKTVTLNSLPISAATQTALDKNPDGTAAGQVKFWNGSSWPYTETSEIFWDDTNKRISFGTASPSSVAAHYVSLTDVAPSGNHQAASTSYYIPSNVSADSIPAGIYGYTQNSTAISGTTGHFIGILGIAQDTANGDITLYGAEGRSNGRSNNAGTYYIGLTGFSAIQVASYTNGFAIGTEGKVEITTDGSTPLAEGIACCFYAPAITGGLTKYSLFAKDIMRVDNEIQAVSPSTPAKIAKMYHDDTNGYLETTSGQLVLKTPSQYVFSDTGNIGFLPLDNAVQVLGYDGYRWANVSSTTIDLYGDSFRLRTAKTPASATASGTTGTICWDANYIYVCTATDTWKRTAISTW